MKIITLIIHNDDILHKEASVIELNTKATVALFELQLPVLSLSQTEIVWAFNEYVITLTTSTIFVHKDDVCVYRCPAKDVDYVLRYIKLGYFD